MKHFVFSLAIFATATVTALAQGPNDSGTYYKAADGKSGYALKTALFNIIKNPDVPSYDGLYTAYKTTDVRPDGKIWDMYSGTTNFTPGTDENHSNYKKEGDNYNREHSMPQSWFSKASPMRSDLMHVIPTDSYVNGMRGDYPYGETDAPTYQSNGGFSKLGPGASSIGYTGKVFEPNDQYKGDFARIYFYMATCYEDKIASWSSPMLSGNKNTVFNSWAITMLLRWAKEDPVSEKEVNRNKGVFGIQGNRNPFVDYPGLEQYIWGDSKDAVFSYDNYDDDIPTGIELLKQTQDDEALYTLTGQRVNSRTQRHGLYIRNGRKYFCK